MEEDFVFKRVVIRLEDAGIPRIVRFELSRSVLVKTPMTDHQFNALDYAHQLEEAGVPAAQAEVHANALARALENCLPSVADLYAVKSELLFKMLELDRALRAEISGLETRLRAEIKAVAERIDRLENRVNWMFGILIATQLTLFAMVAGLYLR